MNLRKFVVDVYIGVFFLAIGGIALIPGEVWQYISDWQKVLFVFYILVGFCGVLVAYWVYEDDGAIRRIEEQNHLLRKRIEELERKKATS